MTGGDDDYGDAFKEAKLEHDKRRQGSAEKQRLQAEVDADAATLGNVVLPQLQAAAEKLEPLGGRVEIRRYGRTGKSLRPTSLAFRITDRQGHHSRGHVAASVDHSPSTRRRCAYQAALCSNASWCWAMENTMIDKVELRIFLAAMVALVVCGCIFARKPTKSP